MTINDDRCCPCSLVVAYLFGEFEPAAAQRIRYLDAVGAGPIDFAADTKLDRIFQSFASYCQFCLGGCLDRLLEWHRASKTSISHDIVFVETAIAALSRFSGDAVSDAFADVAESAACDYFRAVVDIEPSSRVTQFFSSSPPTTSSSSSSTRQYLFDLWSLMLGRLSPYRLPQIRSRFLNGHDDNLQLYRGLRSVDLRLDTDHRLSQSMQFVATLFGRFESSGARRPLQLTIIETLTNVIYPMASQATTTSVNLTPWYSLMTTIFVAARRWSRKAKYRSRALPLMTVVLCVCEPEHLITNFGVLLDALIVFYEDAETRLLALACIQRLFHVYLEQVAYHKNATSNNLATIVRRILFGRHKRLPYVDGRHQLEQDGLVALVLTVAEGKLDLCLSEVILTMLNHPDSFVNEQVQLALQSLLGIVDHRPRFTHHLQLPSRFQTHHGPTITTTLATIADRLQTTRPFAGVDMSPYSSQLSTVLGKIITQCHRSVAKPTSSNASSPSRTSPNALSKVAEMIQLPMRIYQLALTVVPFVWPEGIADRDLLGWIVEASIHPNGGIRSAAAAVVDHIASSSHRGRYIGLVAEVVMAEVMADDVAERLLDDVATIMESDDVSLTSSEATSIEAAAMFWLTSADVVVRMTCLRILFGVQAAAIIDDDAHRCVVDMLEMKELEIVNERHSLGVVELVADAPPSFVDRAELLAMCERSTAIQIIHAATSSSSPQDRWTLILVAIVHRLGGDVARVLFSATATRLLMYLEGTMATMHRNVGMMAMASAGASDDKSLVSKVVARCVQALRTGGDSPMALKATTSLANVPMALVEEVLTMLPATALASFVYRVVAERGGVCRDRFVAFVERIGDDVVDDQERLSVAVVVKRLCELAPMEMALRARMFAMMGRWRSATGSDVVSMAIMRTMAKLLLGPMLGDRVVFPWIHSIIRHTKPGVAEIGLLALQNVLASNPTAPIVEHYLSLCYGADGDLARRYLMVVAEFWRSDANGRLPLADLIHLIVYKLGDGSATVRAVAIDMMALLAEKVPGQQKTPQLIITSHLPDTYLQTQLQISRRYSIDYPDQAGDFLLALCRHLPGVPARAQLLMLRYGQAWIRDVDVAAAPGGALLHRLFGVTVEHGVAFAMELECVWRLLAAATPDNLTCIVRFLLDACRRADLKPTDPDRVFQTSRRIALYLSHVDQRNVIATLVDAIEHDKSSVLAGDVVGEDDDVAATSDCERILSQLDRAIDGSTLKTEPAMTTIKNETTSSTSHLALMLLVEVAYELSSSDDVVALVHWAMIGLDHHLVRVRDDCRSLLVNVIHALVIGSLPLDHHRESDLTEVARRNAAGQLLEHVMSADLLLIWRRTARHGSSPSPTMTEVVLPLLALLPPIAPAWAAYSLKTSLASAPLISLRSLQIFRLVADRLTSLPDLTSLIDHDGDEPTVASEILTTLVALLDRLPSSLLPPLLWFGVDLLSSSPPSSIFMSTVSSLIVLLEQIAVDDHAVRISIMRQRPRRPFRGLQPLVLDGMGKGGAAAVLLSKMTLSSFSVFIDPTDARVLHNAIGLLPWLCSATTMTSEVVTAARSLRRLCETRLDDFAMARALRAFEAGSAKGAVLAEAMAPSLTTMMARHGDATTFAMLTGIVENGDDQQRGVALVIIGALLRHLHWTATSLPTTTMMRALMERHDGGDRDAVLAIVGILLSKTCSAVDGCVHQRSSSVSPAREPSPSRLEAPELTTTPVKNDDDGFDPSKEEEDGAVQPVSLTWNADWARRRRQIYSTHSRRPNRLLLATDQHRDDDDGDRAATMSSPSKLYPALSKEHSSPPSSCSRKASDDWTITRFGRVRRRPSSSYLPSAPNWYDVDTTRSRLSSPISPLMSPASGGSRRRSIIGTGPWPFRASPRSSCSGESSSRRSIG